MITFEQFVEYIKEREGCKLIAYPDSGYGIYTIGYGHTKDVKKGDVISIQVAEKLLLEDIKDVENALRKKYRWFSTMKTNEQYAIIDFCFNCGVGYFGKTSFSRKIQLYYGTDFNYLIADHFNKFIFSNGKVLRGLVIRRRMEYNMYLHNVISVRIID